MHDEEGSLFIILGMTKPTQFLSVVSPVYNNLSTMESVITKLTHVLSHTEYTYELLLIDDGSSDGSRELLRTLSSDTHIRVLFHETNQGIAKTYRHLYQEARYDHIVLFSLDGEWEENDVVRLADTANETQAHMVIGQRKKKAYSFGRWVVSTTYNVLTKVLFGVSTYDAGSIKYIHKEVINTVPIVSVGVFDEAERIIKAARKQYKIISIPVSHYGSKKTKAVGVKGSLLLLAVYDLFRVWVSLTFPGK